MSRRSSCVREPSGFTMCARHALRTAALAALSLVTTACDSPPGTAPSQATIVETATNPSAPRATIPRLTLDPTSFPDWRHVGGEAFYAWDWDGNEWTLVVEGQAKRNGFLVAPGTASDFELTLEVLIDRGNSGVQFRSRVDEAGNRVVGYQMEVDPTDRKWSGGIYEEGLRGWLAPPAQPLIEQPPFRIGEWNTYRIRCEGSRIRTWINGTPVADVTDDAAASGIIALQCHAGDTRIRWRRLALTSLDETDVR